MGRARRTIANPIATAATPHAAHKTLFFTINPPVRSPAVSVALRSCTRHSNVTCPRVGIPHSGPGTSTLDFPTNPHVPGRLCDAIHKVQLPSPTAVNSWFMIRRPRSRFLAHEPASSLGCRPHVCCRACYAMGRVGEKRIVIGRHAARRMRSRGVGLDAVWSTLRQPNVEYRAAFVLDVAGDRWIAERRFDAGIVRIVYEESKTEVFVVTCMWVRNTEVQE